MKIDDLLSRFKIQTKVLAFIFPFVISISAVGLVGLYASGLLQGRLTISNGIMTSLTGFRDVSASMTQFLGQTNEESFADVNTRLKDQKQILANTLSSLKPDAEGADDLRAAIQTTTKVEGGMANLWQMHEQENSLRKDIRAGLNTMIASQLLIDDQGVQLGRTLQVQEGGVKNGLYGAGRLAGVELEIAAIYDGYKAIAKPEEKLKFLNGAMSGSKKMLRKLSGALPADKKALSKELNDAFEALSPMLKAGVIEDTTLPKLEMAMAKVRDVAGAIGVISRPELIKSIKALSDLEPLTIRADGILRDSGRVSKSISAIEIELAQFLATPGKESRDSLIQQFQIIGKDMEALGGSAKGEAFFGELTNKLVPAIDKMTKDSAALVDIDEKRASSFQSAANDVNTIWSKLTTFAQLQKESAGVEREQANQISIGATIVGILIAILAGIGLIATFKGPIGKITSAMRGLAEGALDTAIDGDRRADEIGDMARALGVFKENALEKLRVEQASQDQRTAAEAERARNEAEKHASEEQIALAVRALASGLERLSHGRFDASHQYAVFRLARPFAYRFQRLTDQTCAIACSISNRMR